MNPPVNPWYLRYPSVSCLLGIPVNPVHPSVSAPVSTLGLPVSRKEPRWWPAQVASLRPSSSPSHLKSRRASGGALSGSVLLDATGAPPFVELKVFCGGLSGSPLFAIRRQGRVDGHAKSQTKSTSVPSPCRARRVEHPHVLMVCKHSKENCHERLCDGPLPFPFPP